MTAPKRPKKKKEADRPKSLDEKRAEEAAKEEVTAVEPIAETEDVDKDAMIEALQAEIATKEEQEKKIEELQKALKQAEEKAGKSANVGSKEFKTRPDEEDKKNGIDFFYFEIVWHPKRSESDEENVTLGVNGKMLVWARNKPAVIRSDYLEVADNAFVPKFKQLPGEERKEIGGLKPYTYTINRKITKDEYDEGKKSGDKALHDDLANKGMSV